jgi:hypothetical protein
MVVTGGRLELTPGHPVAGGSGLQMGPGRDTAPWRGEQRGVQVTWAFVGPQAGDRSPGS